LYIYVDRSFRPATATRHKDAAVGVRAYAVWSLGQLDAKEAIPELVRLLGDNESLLDDAERPSYNVATSGATEEAHEVRDGQDLEEPDLGDAPDRG
jgi:HEAT repeat protein